jgi:3-hydroxy acid dehydrogenase / malonic semialdehyde reductase
MLPLKNNLVLITGASSGFGKACAEKFAEQKANLILTARRIDRLEELKNKLVRKHKVKIKVIKLDVRDNKEVEKAIAGLGIDWKKIDILINNAGLARGFNKVYEGNEDDWNEMIDTNVKGLLFVTRQVLPLMIKRRRGHIINIGSTAGHEVYPYGNVYAATKFAVKALSQSIRLDVLDKDIKVSSVDPGMAETEFSIVRFSGDKKRAANVYAGLKPLQAEDVADAVLFCATRPRHVNINEIILTPLAQASSNHVVRKNK